MSNEPKGAMHFEGRKSIGAMEAAENQRRWDEKHYQTVNKKPLHWYDITRAHLNFEVAKGGIIEFLLKLEWWNWSEEEIFDNLEILTSEAGLEELMNKYSKRDEIN